MPVHGGVYDASKQGHRHRVREPRISLRGLEERPPSRDETRLDNRLSITVADVDYVALVDDLTDTVTSLEPLI